MYAANAASIKRCQALRHWKDLTALGFSSGEPLGVGKATNMPLAVVAKNPSASNV